MLAVICTECQRSAPTLYAAERVQPPLPPSAIIRQHSCQMSDNLLILMHFILHLTPISMPDFPLPQCGETKGLASSRQRECETCRC